jgi:tetratricopeptide (TPR) repeat protein
MVLRQTGWSRRCRIATAGALAIMVAWPAGAQLPAADAQPQWESLNAKVMEAYQARDYPNGTALAEKALGLAQRAFGDRDPQTLTSLNNLAYLYQSQRRYAEAEPLYREALRANRDVLGPRHPQTLGRRRWPMPGGPGNRRRWHRR